MRHSAIPLLVLLTALAGGAARALPVPAGGEDHDAVRRAVLDYVEGLYEVQPEFIERSVSPDLVKYGYWREGEGAYVGLAMTRPELVELAARWNEDGTRADEDSPKEVVVFDVLDKTAAAKLTAEWGVDYFHLAKLEGRWQITQVLWQSTPPD